MTPLTCFALTLAQQAPPTTPTDEPPYALIGLGLLLLAVVLVFVEIVIPSAGIIGLTAAAFGMAGLVCLFLASPTLGIIGITVTLAALPVLFAIAVKMMPHMPFAKLLILGNPSGEKDPDEAAERNVDAEDRLEAGATGESLTELRPVGTCRINGKRWDCLAVGGSIESGRTVKVVSVDGMQIKVREEQ